MGRPEPSFGAGLSSLRFYSHSSCGGTLRGSVFGYCFEPDQSVEIRHPAEEMAQAQPLTGFVLVFPRGNAPTTLWFSLPPAFCVRGLGLVLVLAEREFIAGVILRVVLVVLLDSSKVGGGAQSRARDVCEVRIRLWNRTGRISHAEALMSMSEAVVNSSPLLFRCVFVGDSSIFVTNIFSLILGISVAVLAFPDGENRESADS